MSPHSSILAWKIPWMEEPGRLQSMGSWRVGHDWVTSLSLFTFMHWRRKLQSTPVFLPGWYQGWWSLVGSRLWGRTVRHDWSDLAAAVAKVKLKSIQSCLTLFWVWKRVACLFSRESSQPRDQIQVSCIAGWFFTIWATREAQETGVGSLSLLQGLNQGLLHRRQILHQLSYQGSQHNSKNSFNSQMV